MGRLQAVYVVVELIDESLYDEEFGVNPTKTTDNVNHPEHYNKGRFEVIAVIEDWGLNFHLGNAVKYIARAPHKGNMLSDLRKALWYLQREIDRRCKPETEPQAEHRRNVEEAWEHPMVEGPRADAINDKESAEALMRLERYVKEVEAEAKLKKVQPLLPTYGPGA